MRAVRRRTAFISVRDGTRTTLRGRTAHESLFNAANGTYRARARSSYSPFSTSTRGLLRPTPGFAEQLEFLVTIYSSDVAPFTKNENTGSDPIYEAALGDARISISTTRRLPMACRIGGYRCPRASIAWRLGIQAAPILTTIASPSTAGRGDRRASPCRGSRARPPLAPPTAPR